MTEPFTAANPLELMMVEAQAGRMEMAALMTALLSSPLYVAAGADSAGDELSLAALEGRDGARYIPPSPPAAASSASAATTAPPACRSATSPPRGLLRCRS